MTRWWESRLSPRERLAEVVEELFPESVIQSVVQSFIDNGAHRLFMCALANSDLWERQLLYKEASLLVGKINDPQFGDEEIRDPAARCGSFIFGEASGQCSTDGHYLCDECKTRNPELFKDPHSKYYVPPMERRKHKAEW
jgi:hypothetical protein